MNKNFYQFCLFLAGSFVCLYLAFSTTVNIPYASHDSIRYFHKFYNNDSDSQILPMEGVLYAEGRPLTAKLEQLVYKEVNHLSDVSRLRLIAIVVFAFCASLLAMTAVLAGMEIIPAFCLSLVVFTLPGIQEFIFVPYLPNSLAVLLSLLAYFILTRKLMYGVQFIFAFLLLESAFFIYPPSTFFFLFPTVLTVLFNKDWQVSKKVCFRDIFLWALVVVINYLILKVFFYAQIKSSGHEIAFTGKKILQNILTFLPQAMPQVFNLWNVYYSKVLGISVFLAVVIFIIADFFVMKKIGWGRLCALLIIFSIFNLVWFLFGGYMPQEYMASQALVLVMIYWCVEWFGNIWPVFLLCVGLIIANQMTTSNVMNNYSELMFIRSRLAQFVSSSTKEIHVIRLKDRARGYNALPMVYDNLNGTTSDFELPDLFRVALKDMGDPFELHCVVNVSNYGQPFRTLPNAVVIDMNDLVYILSPEQK